MRFISKSCLILLVIIGINSGCEKDRGFVFVPLAQEIELGRQLDSTIRATPGEYPILPQPSNQAAYNYVEGVVHEILNNDAEPLKYKDKFEWKVTIIDTNILNAFAAPGGYIYVYTGLLKYLEDGASLAGVLGHEMAHADLRHSMRQMQKVYGLNFAATLIFGKDKSQLGQILTDVGEGLAGLQFSRDDEYQADEYSVRYLDGTKYDPRGVEEFFQKLKTEGKTNDAWEVLSTHPADDKRIAHVDEIWNSLGSPTGGSYETDYITFKALLP
jgi:beta-barrel assembly-enhancing protease